VREIFQDAYRNLEGCDERLTRKDLEGSGHSLKEALSRILPGATEVLATDSEVPGSIPGATRFSEK
jgi:hypothetical protein